MDRSRTDLSMTEAHGGASSSSSMESSSTSTSYGSYADDGVGGGVRQLLRENRGMVISNLAEKLTTALLDALMLSQVLTPAEGEQVKKKQRRQPKASCLVDIVLRKRGTDLKIFADTLKTYCPKAHALIHVPEPLHSTSVESLQRGVGLISLASRGSNSPQPSSNDSSNSYRGTRSVTVSSIDRSVRKAASLLENCLNNSHFGLFLFVRQLMTVIRSGVDIALVPFDEGLFLMHLIIKVDRIDYLRALQYTGIWNKLWNVRTDCDSGPFVRLTPVEYATKLKRTKLVEALNEIATQERSLHDIDRCARAGDVLRFRDMKVRCKQYIVRSIATNTSVLNYACQSGVLTMVMEVIQTEQDFGCNRPSVDKEVALCVDLGYHLLIEPLIQYGSVNVNHVIINGKSLTERAAVNGDTDTFRELERLGAIPSDTVLALASAQNRFPFLQDLLTTNHLQRTKYNLNFQDRRRKSSAHFAAEKGNAEVVRLLLEKGLDINLKDKRDFTILHSAASGGSVPTVQAVIDACERQHVLHRMLTSRDRYLGSERCFLVRGRDSDQPAWHYVEADRGRIDIFRKRTQGGPVDVANFGIVKRSGWGTNPTPEVVQEVEGMYDVVNADANGPQDMQPLHVAIIKSHEPVALKLISIMQDVGEPDCFGLTPLHLAAMRGHVNAIKALLEKGANRTVLDRQGRTALDIAKQNEKPEAVEALTPQTEQDVTEIFRRKLLDVYHNLNKEKLEKCQQEGQDPNLYMKSLLRDLVADSNDFLFDHLGEGPIAAESGSDSYSAGRF